MIELQQYFPDCFSLPKQAALHKLKEPISPSLFLALQLFDKLIFKKDLFKINQLYRTAIPGFEECKLPAIDAFQRLKMLTIIQYNYEQILNRIYKDQDLMQLMKQIVDIHTQRKNEVGNLTFTNCDKLGLTVLVQNFNENYQQRFGNQELQEIRLLIFGQDTFLMKQKRRRGKRQKRKKWTHTQFINQHTQPFDIQAVQNKLNFQHQFQLQINHSRQIIVDTISKINRLHREATTVSQKRFSNCVNVNQQQFFSDDQNACLKKRKKVKPTINLFTPPCSNEVDFLSNERLQNNNMENSSFDQNFCNHEQTILKGNLNWDNIERQLSTVKGQFSNCMSHDEFLINCCDQLQIQKEQQKQLATSVKQEEDEHSTGKSQIQKEIYGNQPDELKFSDLSIELVQSGQIIKSQLVQIDQNIQQEDIHPLAYSKSQTKLNKAQSTSSIALSQGQTADQPRPINHTQNPQVCKLNCQQYQKQVIDILLKPLEQLQSFNPFQIVQQPFKSSGLRSKSIIRHQFILKRAQFTQLSKITEESQSTYSDEPQNQAKFLKKQHVQNVKRTATSYQSNQLLQKNQAKKSISNYVQNVKPYANQFDFMRKQNLVDDILLFKKESKNPLPAYPKGKSESFDRRYGLKFA